MSNYYVIAPDGQRYGPADLAVLTQWATEGRLAPNSLLQDAATGAQIIARAVPGLVFSNLPPAAPAGANPYDMPNPVMPPNFHPYGQQPWRQPSGVTPNQFAGAVATTVLAPVLLPFCWIGLGCALYGCITGGQLLKENRRGAGITFLTFNIVWIVGYLIYLVLTRNVG